MLTNEFIDGSVSVDMEAAINEYNSFMESCDTEINNMFAEFNMIHEKVMLESEIMDTVPEDMMMVYEAGKTNIFTKIGEFVIKIFSKIKELIDKGITKIKETLFKSKSDMQKLEIFIKKNPRIKSEEIDIFEDAIRKGAVNLEDMRSIKEISNVYNEIIEMSKKKDVDPKSLRGKWNAGLEKVKKMDKSAVVITAGAVTTVGSAILLIKRFMPDALKSTNTLTEQKKILDENRAVALERLKKLTDKKTGNNVIDENEVGIAELTLQMTRVLSNKISVATNDNVNFITKMATGISKLVDKINPDSKKAAKRLMSDLDTVASDKKDAEEAELKKKLDQAKKESIARKSGELEEFFKHQKGHEKKIKAESDARK